MKEIKICSAGINHTAADLGEFDNLTDYTYVHPKLKRDIGGKVFLGEALKSSACEISFQTLAPGQSAPILHKHKEHEEIYIIIKGEGQFQADGEIFNVSEGSIIRVAPDCNRAYRNNSVSPMIFACIQCQADSISSKFVEDGYLGDGELKW
jgi:quercetin dioxygenase-like cupin family protein